MTRLGEIGGKPELRKADGLHAATRPRGLPAASSKLPSLLIAAYIDGGIRQRALSADNIGVSMLSWMLFACVNSTPSHAVSSTLPELAKLSWRQEV
jgi:hypothetical protein